MKRSAVRGQSRSIECLIADVTLAASGGEPFAVESRPCVSGGPIIEFSGESFATRITAPAPCCRAAERLASALARFVRDGDDACRPSSAKRRCARSRELLYAAGEFSKSAPAPAPSRARSSAACGPTTGLFSSSETSNSWRSFAQRLAE